VREIVKPRERYVDLDERVKKKRVKRLFKKKIEKE
jgi:hypothetical protein